MAKLYMRGITEQTLVYIALIIIGIILIIFFIMWLSPHKLSSQISSTVGSLLNAVFGPLFRFI